MRRPLLFSALFLAAAAIVAYPTRADTITTTNYFCSIKNGTAYTNNIAFAKTAGWSFDTSGNGTKQEKGIYSYPSSFVDASKHIVSPSWGNGTYITKIVFGALVSNTNREITVAPESESGSPSPTAKALTATSVLQETEFVFSVSETVKSFTVTVSKPGSTGTAYIYYAIVTTESVSGGPFPLSSPTGLDLSGAPGSTGFSLTWNAVENAAGYAVEVLDAAGVAVGSVSFDGTTASVTNLASDTTYTAKAKALAPPDSTDYEDSAWSDPITVTTALGNGLVRATLLDETFSGVNGKWGSSTLSTGTYNRPTTDWDGWYFTNVTLVAKAIKAGGAGTDISKQGWVETPTLSLVSGYASATINLSFLAAAYNGKTTHLSVGLVDLASGTTNTVFADEAVTTAITRTSGEEEASPSEYAAFSKSVVVPSSFRFVFTTTDDAVDRRLYLDSIKITQVYDPNYAILSAPTGVAGSDIGKHGFTVSWTGVANATGYEVWLNGAVAGSCASTDTSTPLSGLSDGTTYSVQVKALGDNLHFGDSPLSTAISVTTPADAQKIGFTVTGAPAGDVFAGDTVAFTVTAENEATHASERVSFSGIAGATFTAATGAFSWTPAESDVGSNVATFTSGDYSTNVTITVVSALKAETLAAEHFSKITSTSWKSSTGYAATMDGDLGTWTGISLIKTKSAIIVGKADETGTAVSPVVELKTRTPGSLSVSFDTGSLPGKTASIKASILDAADDSVVFEQTFASLASLPADATAVSDAGAHFTLSPGPSVALPAAMKVKFETVQTSGTDSQRAYVDTVIFTQTVSARIPDLPAPTGLALAGEPGETGFSVAWNAVTGATNYAVRVTDASGVVVFSAPFCAAAQATVTGLADDEAYAVQVRATGDEALWFASPWSDALAVRTARSALHPTLAFGGWQNAVGDGKVYGGLMNTAAVSALRDNGTNAVVALASVLPAPAAEPTLADGVLSWIPDDADTNKTYTVTFRMDGVYETNLSFKVLSVAPLAPPEVAAGPVAWDAFGLAWNTQYRAAGYAVRAWTDCPNPNATATRVEEDFAGWPAARPSWWSYHTLAGGYKDAAAPVSFDATGDELKTYDLGGPISSVSFHAAGHSIAGSTSELTVVGIAADETETVLATLTAEDIGQTDAGIDRTYSVPAGVRRIAWRYTKDKGGVGVGSVVIEGTGFATPRWLPGWGPAAKDVGLAQVCTVKKPRPGKALGPNPANKKEDLFEPRVNYAEVAARDAAGATRATVVAVEVPAPPRSVRATMLIAR